jgi:signal-transduction protein with cAMP-binding, CBS, and nucleotidyltransferase domain
MKQLTENHFTALGTQQFFEHTGLMTLRVKDVIQGKNPIAHINSSITDALVEMTKGGYGAVTIVDDKNRPIGIFTDGDLRRLVEAEGANAIQKKLVDITMNTPQNIDANELLYNAQAIFNEKRIDSIVVTDGDVAIGMLDIQDLQKLK